MNPVSQPLLVAVPKLDYLYAALPDGCGIFYILQCLPGITLQPIGKIYAMSILRFRT